jgi:hypothetical protein
VLRDLAVVLGGMLVLGVLCGVLWWLLVDPAAYTKLRDGGVMQEEDLSKQFSADGLYVVIAAVAGLASGIALIWWRVRDVLLTSVLLVLGAVLAAAKVGTRVPERLNVDAFTVYLAWPISALLGALLVLVNVTPRSRPTE